MYSLVSSAVLATAVFGQAAIGATLAHQHSHAHLHHKKAPVAEVAVEEKRGLLSDALSGILSSCLSRLEVLEGANEPFGEGSAIGLGGDGAFQIEFQNKSPEEVVVVVWSGHDQWSSIEAMEVRISQANITYPIAAGSSQIVSFDPDCHTNSQISGAFAAVYADTVVSYAGQISNTWGEFTFTTANEFSTLDVSRLVNMAGNDMTIQTYPSKGGNLACTANMDTCAYVCADGSTSCPGGSMTSCSGAGTTAGNWGADGGCSGMTASEGYVVVAFS